MSWLSRLLGGSASPADRAAAQAAKSASEARMAAWEQALRNDEVPDFVQQRLAAARDGKTPWMSTMTPAELLLAKSHGIRPLATVTGTCWYQYGRSWTDGHAAGWSSALARIRAEALACGANAVVDVKMRTVRIGIGQSMDFTLIGTAIRMEGLAPSTNPVVATVPALEFVRLLEMGIVPTGLAVGARYNWLYDNMKAYGGSIFNGNQALSTLGGFWEELRREAHQQLREDAASQGGGVLAHTQFGQLIKFEETQQTPVRYLGRHIVIGSVVDVMPNDGVPHKIQTVVDMRDELSPLVRATISDNNLYQSNESEGPI
jgi:hypothetical protein